MKEKITFTKNGRLKYFNIDETKKILLIGYTLSSDHTEYENAIIVRESDEYEKNTILVNGNEAIMKLFNIFAGQEGVLLSEIFKLPYSMELSVEQEEYLNKLIQKGKDLNDLYQNKGMKNGIASFLTLFATLNFILVNSNVSDRDRLLQSILMILSSINATMLFGKARKVPTQEEQRKYDELIDDFSNYLLDESVKYTK